MKLCLTLAEESLSALNTKLSSYDGRVELIEARLDFLEQPGIPVLPSSPRSQFIATLRPRREGGEYDGPEKPRLELLGKAAEQGFHWIDIEHDAQVPESLPAATRLIRSRHFFDAFPDDLDARFPVGRRRDLGKLAVKIEKTSQLTRLLDWIRDRSGRNPSIVIGMGELGQPSRYLAPILGSEWTYVCEDSDLPRAPGQFTLEEGLALGRPEAGSHFYAIIGRPVGHSLSPPLHNALFRHYGLAGSYIRLPLDELDPWFEYLARTPIRFRGFSVTLPFKTDVLRFCSGGYESPVESINTLVYKDGEWKGLNTDYRGFLAPLLNRKIRLRGASAVVVGYGGVAHTAVGALLSEKVRVTVTGRDAAKGKAFAQSYGCDWMPPDGVSGPLDLLVNTTPVGQYPHIEESPLPEQLLRFDVVYDLVYNPEMTRLLRVAKQKGSQIISGNEMFIEQAAQQFLTWTGIDPDRQLMREVIREQHSRHGSS